MGRSPGSARRRSLTLPRSSRRSRMDSSRPKRLDARRPGLAVGLAHQFFDLAPIALGRSPSSSLADTEEQALLAWWRGRTVVFVRLCGERCADAFDVDSAHHDDPGWSAFRAELD